MTALRLLALGVLLALVASWPMPLHLGDEVVGPGQSSVQYWLVHRAREALAEGHLPTRSTPAVLHPTGLLAPPLGATQLYVAAGAAFLLPLQGAVHLALLGALALGFTATFLLLRQDGRSIPAAALGGVLFAASPFQLGLVARGEAFGSSAFWLPTLLLALAAWLRHQRGAALLGLLLAANALVLEGLSLVLPAAALGLAWLGHAAWCSRTLRVPLLTGIVTAGAVAPLLVALASSSAVPAERSLSVLDWGRPQPPLVRPEGGAWRDAALLGSDGPYADPGRLLLRISAPASGTDRDAGPRVFYLGAVALALGLAGLLRWRTAGHWVLGGLAALLLALGPDLAMNGYRLGWGDAALPLPARALASLPGPAQLWLGYYSLPGLTLALAALAARGLDGLLEGMPAGLAARTAGLLAVLALGDAAWACPGLPLSFQPAGTGAADAWLAGRPQSGAVVDWPCDRGGRDRGLNGWILFQATRHGRPVGVASRGRSSQVLTRLSLQGPEEKERETLEVLRRAGFGWLVVRPGRLPEAERARLPSRLAALLGDPAMVDAVSGDRAWALPVSAAKTAQAGISPPPANHARETSRRRDRAPGHRASGSEVPGPDERPGTEDRPHRGGPDRPDRVDRGTLPVPLPHAGAGPGGRDQPGNP